MRIFRLIIKPLAYFILNRIVVTREEMILTDAISSKKLRDNYSYKPEYTPTVSNNARFTGLPSSVEVSPFYIYCIKGVCLIGPYGIPVMSNGKILQEQSRGSVIKYIRRTIATLGLIKFFKAYVEAVFTNRGHAINCGFHLVPNHGYTPATPNYCHWILENLPQLFALTSIDIDEPKLIVNANMAKWQNESLSALGFESAHIFPLSSNLTRVKTLFLSSMRGATSSNSERDPLGRSWVINNLKNSELKEPKFKNPKRIFLSRQDMTRGFISNMDELQSLLDQYNIETYHPGSISFKDDINIFNAAELLVAPHGAALANMVFTKDCHVIELVAGVKRDADFFYFTALEFGLSYDTAECERDLKYESENKHIDEAWRVDILMLERSIKIGLSMINKN